MQIILLFCIFFAVHGFQQGVTINVELNDEWEAYKQQYGRNYEYITEITRRIIWEKNLKYIQKHNIEYNLGKHTFYLGVNEYADLTHEEFKAKYFGIGKRTKLAKGSLFLAPENMEALPLSVDWRTKGYVTPVKDQKQCGSCWAFSSTGSLEGQHFRKTGNLISFSEQQLVDCTEPFGNYGCNGGYMDNSFKYVKQFGIESELDYIYTAKAGPCRFDRSKVVGSCTGYTDIPVGNETSLAIAVASVGPISVAIDASNPSFHLYGGGIYNEPKCEVNVSDHAVLVVGYGSENGKNYWLVKNSWGVNWGISGYIKMSKDQNNQCGIATMASYPLV